MLRSLYLAAGLAVLICMQTVAWGTEAEQQIAYQPGPDEAEVPEMFRLEAATFESSRRPIKTTATGYDVWEVTFPSPVETAYAVNNTVHCEYFRPGQAAENPVKKCPAVIVLHILGGDFDLSRLFARQLAQGGVAALFVKLPYYGPRRPEGAKMRMVSENPRETVAGMRQAILDIRRGVAWLAAQDEVDAERLGVFGISLGGITGALALAIEPRLSMGCLMLAGGDVARVAWDNPELRKLRDRWTSQGGSKEEFFELWKSIDPITYADRARGKRVLMLNARNDEVIPPACSESLWRALGEPDIVWYDAGHYSAARFLFDGLGRVSRFFRASADQSAAGKIKSACK
ncbi:MAG TPA: alpha/beta hydrolase family protein [Pirellulales bacterium]|nr:alpha/beta hydrolase family protein [Pirellulales bacterium]